MNPCKILKNEKLKYHCYYIRKTKNRNCFNKAIFLTLKQILLIFSHHRTNI